jgi:hypothetical protein
MATGDLVSAETGAPQSGVIFNLQASSSATSHKTTNLAGVSSKILGQTRQVVAAFRDGLL